MAKKREKQTVTADDVGTVGDSWQAPELATRGKAHAAGNLDKLSPGMPGHSQSAPARALPEKGAHTEKNFVRIKGEKPQEMIRVIKDGRVLASGTRKELQDLSTAISDALKK